MNYPLVQDSEVFRGSVLVSKRSAGGVVLHIRRGINSTFVVLSIKETHRLSTSLLRAARYTKEDDRMGRRKKTVGP